TLSQALPTRGPAADTALGWEAVCSEERDRAACRRTTGAAGAGAPPDRHHTTTVPGRGGGGRERTDPAAPHRLSGPLRRRGGAAGRGGHRPHSLGCQERSGTAPGGRESGHGQEETRSGPAARPGTGRTPRDAAPGVATRGRARQ